MTVLEFSHLDKTPEKINLKQGKIDFGSSFSLWLVGFVGFCKVDHPNEEHMVEQSFLPHGSQEAEREESPTSYYSFRGIPLELTFLPPLAPSKGSASSHQYVRSCGVT
jgi:hypothetical protein